MKLVAFCYLNAVSKNYYFLIYLYMEVRRYHIKNIGTAEAR